MKLYQRIEAIGKSRLSSRARLVLCMMANFAWEDEERPVYPGIARLAEMTGYCANSVSKTLEEIEAAGLAKRLRGHGFKSGMRTATEYVIDWEAVAAAAEPKSKRGAANLPRRENSQGLVIQSSQSLEIQNPQGLEVQPLRDWGTVHTPEQQPGSDPVGASAPEHAQPVDDDRPSHLAPPPVSATDDGRTADGEGLPFAHAPTPSADLRGSDAAGGGGEPAKKRKKAAPAGPSAADLDAWSDCAILWQQVSGKVRALNPEAGAGRSLAEAIAKIGARRMLARLEGAKVDDWVKGIMESPKPLSLVALCRHDLPWLDRVEAAGEEILSAREASAPVDWRGTLDRWVQAPDTHPGLAEPALWTTLRAAAIAHGARGDAPAVLRWLADPVNRAATLAALVEPEKPTTLAGPRVRTWEEVLEACRTQGSAGLSVAEYGVVTDVGRAADGRGDLVAYVGNASGDLATRMRRYASHLARGRVTVLAVVA